MLPAHQLQGELAIPVHTYMQSCPQELGTRGIRTRIARTLTFSKRAHVCVRAGGVCARRADRTKVPLSLRNPAMRSPHARTRWRKHPCKKRGPVLARSLLLGTTVFFTHGKHRCPHQSFKYFVLPKALKPYKKLQKCQKLLANFGSEDTV